MWSLTQPVLEFMKAVNGKKRNMVVDENGKKSM